MSNISNYYHLSSIFPQNGYRSPLILHYDIVYDQFEKKIESIKKNISHLDINYQCPVTKLSPLHLASIKGNSTALKFLLNQEKIDWASKDTHGWTFLHHLILTENKKMIDLAKSILGKDKYEKLVAMVNNDGLTPQVLLDRTKPPSESKVKFFYLNEETRKITEGNSKEFKKLTGTQLTDSMVIAKDEIIDYWSRTSYTNPSKTGKEVELLVKKSFESQLPCHYLAKLSANMGYGVFAGEDRDRLQIEGFYCGYHSLENSGLNCDTDYLLDQIDPTKIGGLFSKTNDGFPMLINLSIVYGGAKVYPLISTRALKKGEELQWNYGPDHAVKINYYSESETSKKALDAYCETLTKEKMVEIENISLDASLEETIQIEYFAYMLHTPSALMRVLFENRINAKDLSKKLEDEKFKKLMRIDFTGTGNWFSRNQAIRIGVKYQEEMEKINDLERRTEFATNLSGLLSSLLEKYSVTSTLMALDRIFEIAKVGDLLTKEAQLVCRMIAADTQKLLDWHQKGLKSDENIPSLYNEVFQLIKEFELHAPIRVFECLICYSKNYSYESKSKAILESLSPLLGGKFDFIEDKEASCKVAQAYYKFFTVMSTFKQDPDVNNYEKEVRKLLEVLDTKKGFFRNYVDLVRIHINQFYPDQEKLFSSQILEYLKFRRGMK